MLPVAHPSFALRRKLLGVRRAFVGALVLTMAAVAGSICATTASVPSAEAAPQDAPAQAKCGAPGQPACPLQGWMRTKMAAPLAAHDLESVARGFDAIGPQAPNGGWAGWAAAAKAGAEAARKNDLSATRAACQSCHSAHREAYRKDHRSRPPPP